MKFAKEVIELMAACPGRDFKMIELIRYATGGRDLSLQERNAARQSVLRVLRELTEMGSVLRRPTRPGVRNAATYRWRTAT